MLLSEGPVDKGFFSPEPESLDGMIHTDHLATPHKMTDSSGAVVWSAYYKPFGAATVTLSTITNNLRFPGQYFDAETGLNYNYFRDYNPVIGRYIEKDPIGLRGGISLYRYVRNNPVNQIDPSGNFDWVPVIVIGIPVTIYIVNWIYSVTHPEPICPPGQTCIQPPPDPDVPEAPEPVDPPDLKPLPLNHV